MAAVKIKPMLLLLLFVLLQTNLSSFCQNSAFPIHQWVNDLTGRKDSTFNILLRIKHELEESDSVAAFRALAEMEKNAPASDHYFNAGLLYLKGWVHKRFNLLTGKMYAKQCFANAMKEAYYTG